MRKQVKHKTSFVKNKRNINLPQNLVTACTFSISLLYRKSFTELSNNLQNKCMKLKPIMLK